MRKIMEPGFYFVYLIFIIVAGIIMMTKLKSKKHLFIFGLACVLLGFGDAFHLIPRAMGIFSGTLDDPDEKLNMLLGFGKLITSVTMTLFYVCMYYFIYEAKNIQRKPWLDIVVYILVITRLILCLLPQNNWITNDSSLTISIIRNIPFTLLGILVIVLSKIHLNDKPYRWLWLLIILSFGFYLPVVLFASKASWVGFLMLPKTICYIIIGTLGLIEIKSSN